MKTLLACALGTSFLVSAAVCAIAGELRSTSTVTVYAGPASIRLPASELAQAPATADLKPSLMADGATARRPVRVVLASPYAAR